MTCKNLRKCLRTDLIDPFERHNMPQLSAQPTSRQAAIRSESSSIVTSHGAAFSIAGSSFPANRQTCSRVDFTSGKIFSLRAPSTIPYKAIPAPSHYITSVNTLHKTAHRLATLILTCRPGFAYRACLLPLKSFQPCRYRRALRHRRHRHHRLLRR